MLIYIFIRFACRRLYFLLRRLRHLRHLNASTIEHKAFAHWPVDCTLFIALF